MGNLILHCLHDKYVSCCVGAIRVAIQGPILSVVAALVFALQSKTLKFEHSLYCS